MTDSPRRATTLMSALVAALLAARGMAGAEPVLDVIVTTNLTTSKEHAGAYHEAIRAQLADALTSLSPVTESPDGKPPKDGAARFRLTAEHKGTANVGDTLKAVGEHPTASGAKAGLDKSRYVTTWYLPYQHKGTIAFQLAEWKDGAYKVLDSWTVAVPDPLETDEHRGLVAVADLKQDASKAKIDFNPKFPRDLAKARDEALTRILPGSIRDGFFQRLVSARIAKVKGTADTIEAELALQNRSPWAVKKLRVGAVTQTMVLVGDSGANHELEFNPPLAPGKSATRVVSGPATKVNAKLAGVKPGVTFGAIQFEPLK
ncbi:MAG TPA: hypothetical protein VKE40_14535 [Gemmataceae bacterium]|nr:hypothetical protein [Gemmataceae bacterium]